MAENTNKRNPGNQVDQDQTQGDEKPGQPQQRQPGQQDLPLPDRGGCLDLDNRFHAGAVKKGNPQGRDQRGDECER